MGRGTSRYYTLYTFTNWKYKCIVGNTVGCFSLVFLSNDLQERHSFLISNHLPCQFSLKPHFYLYFRFRLWIEFEYDICFCEPIYTNTSPVPFLNLYIVLKIIIFFQFQIFLFLNYFTDQVRIVSNKNILASLVDITT